MNNKIIGQPFSKKYGYRLEPESNINKLEVATPDLRYFIVEFAYKYKLSSRELRDIVCPILRVRQNKLYTLSELIDTEVRDLIDNCEWYFVYDIIEGIVNIIKSKYGSERVKNFSKEMNDLFLQYDIPWKLVKNKIEFRGTDTYEAIIRSAGNQLKLNGYKTSRNELNEALQDLSRRPKPDITGAIHHAIAALECLAREACGNQNATLGDIIRRNPDLLPRPLDIAVEKLWGYASENARHIREGREATFEEAELIVGVSAAIITYMTKKF